MTSLRAMAAVNGAIGGKLVLQVPRQRTAGLVAPKIPLRLRALGNADEKKRSGKRVMLPKKEAILIGEELRDKGCRDDVAPVSVEVVYDGLTEVRYELRSIRHSIKSLEANLEAKIAAVPTYLQIVQILAFMLGVWIAIIKFIH